MKKQLLYSVLVLLVGVLYISLVSSSFNPFNDRLGSKKGVSLENVNKILSHFGVSVSTLAQANEFAQKNLLRKGERWDIQEDKKWHVLMNDKKDLLLNDLASLGMIDAVEPKQKEYTYALLMGSLKSTVAYRLNYLAELRQDGFSFKEIVLLGGDRQLREVEKEGLPENITTEAQMMYYLCAHHDVLKNDTVRLVNAPMIQHEDGSCTRPTTDSTIVYFSKTAPQDGSCLVISNNPYVVRQTKVTQRILDQVRFPTHGAGKKINVEKVDIVMLMDEFARTIYEEYQQTLQIIK